MRRICLNKGESMRRICLNKGESIRRPPLIIP
jgi:hypothetical protein